jgi:hypothetical protein
MKYGRETNKKNIERDILMKENERAAQSFMYQGGTNVLYNTDPDTCRVQPIGEGVIQTVSDSSLKKVFINNNDTSVNVEIMNELTNVPNAYNRSEKIAQLNKLKVLALTLRLVDCFY